MSTKTPFGAAPAPTAAVKPQPAAQKDTEPTQDEIAIRAYELFLNEGCAYGRDVEHWLRAEEQLRAEKKKG